LDESVFRAILSGGGFVTLNVIFQSLNLISLYPDQASHQELPFNIRSTSISHNNSSPAKLHQITPNIGQAAEHQGNKRYRSTMAKAKAIREVRAPLLQHEKYYSL
jgi:hypothetical protein